MGNDGGSIPTRRELVKEAARNPTATELKESHLEQQQWNWSHDPLSQQPLVDPVVSDSLGRLYNKDAVLEFLLPGDDDGDGAKRAEQEKIVAGAIKSLRDVVAVRFTTDSEAGSAPARQRPQRWICPITNKELGASTRAVYIVPCGHAFSEQAVREVKDDKCLTCGEHYAPNDLIPILPTIDTDIARLSLRMKTLKDQGLAHSLRKIVGGKKRKQTHTESATTGAMIKAPLTSADGTAPPPASLKNDATASLTAKVMKEQEDLNKRRKLDNNKNLQSLFTKKTKGANGKNNDFMNRGFDIPAPRKQT